MTVEQINKGEKIKPSECTLCGKVVDKWINYMPIGDFCINCAHATMRILFQDIIEYHNGKPVSLLDVMYHGNKDHDNNRLEEELKPNGQRR